MHRHAIVPVMLVFAALLAGGCYETGSTYTVNPDGTGKVHLEARFTPMMIAMGTDRKDPESKARKAARDLMKNAKGIEVWKDVTAKVGEDGRTVFSGTGYFRDVSRVKFQNLGENVIDIHREENSLTFTVNMGREKKEEAASARKEMTGEEIAAAMEVTPERIRALRIFAGSASSLDAPIDEDDGTCTLQDFLQDRTAPDGLETCIAIDLKEKLAQVLDRLPMRERRVLRMRFGLDADREHTLSEVGQDFSLTRERIRQIEMQALRRLRRECYMVGLQHLIDQ